MGVDVVWCDELVRLEPLKGKVIGGDGQQPIRPPVTLASARNEFACFQLLVGPIKKGDVVTVSGGILVLRQAKAKGPGKARISSRQYDVFVEWYQKYDGVCYPEVCVPQDVVGGSTPALRKKNKLPAAKYAGFWVDLFVPADAKPGDYDGKVTVKVGKESIKVPVAISVSKGKIGADCCIDVSMNNYATVVQRGWDLGSDAKSLASDKTRRVTQGVFRTAHDHRMFLHYLPYGHSGYVPPTFAPPLEGEGPNKRVADWSQWDKTWGPLFDGSAFKGTRRGAVPVKRFYLPLNLNWPADFLKHGKPGYEAEWRAVGKQMVEHFKKKGWTKTRFDMFLNHKQRFRYYPWDTEETRFLEDNDNHYYFRKLWEGTFDRKSTKPVTFDYTLGTTWTYGHDIRSDMKEFIDLYIAGTSGIAWDFDLIPGLHKAGRQLMSCTNSGSIPVSTRAPFFVPLQMWMLDIDGYMPRWCTTGQFGKSGVYSLADKGASTFLYSGAAFGSEQTFASLRMKVQRQALQMVDELQAAAKKARGGKWAIQKKVDKTLGVPHVSWLMKKPKYVEKKLPKDWVGADFATEEPPVAGWDKFSAEQFRAVKQLAASLVAGGK
jgi:hypothetical protein